MPRSVIDLPEKVEYLSILDENGAVDPELEPDISDRFLLKLYRTMLLARRFDERLMNLQRQGRIGTFPPISGQEAAHLGTTAVLESSDWFVPAFRETTSEIWRGRSLESIIIYYNGFGEGAYIPEERKDLPLSVPVGSQILHAVGLAWAVKYRKTDRAVITYFGDGATSQGDFHEGLNFAGVFQVPAIFVCQNNHWAISIPINKQTRSRTIAQKALAYGIPGIQIDGNDILAAYAAGQEALERARSGDGPTLIECVTYRLTVHTTADDPRRYRSDEEVEDWKKRDPITRFQKYLVEKKLLSADKIEAIQTEVLGEIQTAVDNAEEQMQKMGDPMHMFEHAYAELPAGIRSQKAEFARELAEMKGESR
ncbi:MAG: pyruvate dehydrogenase (acetyl-transferring) E1 component subunit alpha [Desulfobacterales bacterium]|nr:pyruvate dehydrogenase (acetyl-transferring) E1 component subunit alpha [Desulfobacterales bacterium]